MEEEGEEEVEAVVIERDASPSPRAPPPLATPTDLLDLTPQVPIAAATFLNTFEQTWTLGFSNLLWNRDTVDTDLLLKCISSMYVYCMLTLSLTSTHSFNLDSILTEMIVSLSQ